VVVAAGSALCGCAPGFGLLLTGRIVQGVGAAAASPASMGLLLAATGPAHRSHYAARWTGMAALGVCLGPIVGGALTDVGSWRWAFLVNLPVVASVLLGCRVLPETPRQPGRALADPLGAVLLAIAAAAVTLGISEASAWGMLGLRTLSALGVGLGLIAIFVRHCTRVDRPLLDLRLLAQRRTALATVTTVLYSSGFFGLLLTFVLFLVGRWQLSLLDSGAALLPMGLVVVALTVRVGRLAARIGFRLPLSVGAGCMALGLSLAAALIGGSHFTATWFPIVVLIGVGIGLCFPLLVAAAIADLPASELAAATAVNQCARQIGAALGIAVAVAVLGSAPVASVERFHTAWLVSGGFCALAALAAAGIRRAPAL
jgi:NTE family protein